MRVSKTSRVCLATLRVAVGCLLTIGVAQASPGDHIGNENAQVIPALEVGVMHRTNPYLTEGVAGGGDPVVGGTAVYIDPSIGVRAKNSDAVFHFDLLYDARKYLEADVQNLDRFNNLRSKVGLELLPAAKVGLKLNDSFSIVGYEAEDPDQVSVTAYQTHILNDLGGAIGVHPGGPLEVDAGGKVTVDQWNVPPEFKSNAGDRTTDVAVESGLTGPGLNTRLAYGPTLDGKWRFFPKTAVVANFTYQVFRWQDNVLDAQGDGVSREEVGDFLGIPSGHYWKAKAGLQGRVTEKLTVGLLAGFGQDYYNEDSVSAQADTLGIGGNSEFDGTAGYATDLKKFPAGVLAQVEGKYAFAKDQSFILSYARDFQDVYFTNYVDYDRVLGEYDGLFAERFGLQVSGVYRYERYVGEVSRNDHFVKVGLDTSYKVKRYLDLDLGGGWARRGSADGQHPEIEYDDVRVQGGVRFTY